MTCQVTSDWSVPMRPAFILSILILTVVILQQGCSTPVNEWRPHVREEVRSTIQTVGLMVSEELPRVTLDLPSKGAASGAGRKAGKWAGNWLIATGGVLAAGAQAGQGGILAATTAGGMLAVTPVVAGTGALYGAIQAPSAESVESQETQMQGVLQAGKLIGELEQQVLRHITSRTDVVPVLHPRTAAHQAGGDGTGTESKTDAQLKIVLTSVELRGPFDVDPPLALHLEAAVTLSLYGTVVRSQTSSYVTGSRHLTEWTADETQPFREAVDISLSRLAELIVDDLFLAYSFDHDHRWRKTLSITKR